MKQHVGVENEVVTSPINLAEAAEVFGTWSSSELGAGANASVSGGRGDGDGDGVLWVRGEGSNGVISGGKLGKMAGEAEIVVGKVTETEEEVAEWVKKKKKKIAADTRSEIFFKAIADDDDDCRGRKWWKRMG